MYRILLLVVISLTTHYTAFSQKKYGPTNDSLYLGFYRDSIEMLGKPTYMIVPFHPDKYMTEVDQDIAKGTAYTYQHTRGFFRKGLDNAMIIASKAYNNYISMHADIPAVNMDLDFFYRMTKNPVVVYEQPKVQQSEGFKKQLATYWEKLQREVGPEVEPGTRIERGEIVSVADNRPYITKTAIINDIVVDSLFPKYDAEYVICVNELSLLNAAANQTAYEQDNYQRVIVADITVFNHEGQELFSVKKKEYFHSYENDLRSIIKDHFLPLGYEIIYALDSYRFLKAGLTPLSEAEVELSKNKSQIKFPTLQKFK